MPPFRFRLERVLAVRRREEEIALDRLAVARRRLEEARAALAEVEARAEEAARAQAAALRGPLVVEDLKRLHAWRARIEAERSAAAAAVLDASAEERARREAAVETSRKRRLLDRLRERRFGEWRLEEERAEILVLDEIGTSAHLRRRGEAA